MEPNWSLCKQVNRSTSAWVQDLLQPPKTVKVTVLPWRMGSEGPWLDWHPTILRTGVSLLIDHLTTDGNRMSEGRKGEMLLGSLGRGDK